MTPLVAPDGLDYLDFQHTSIRYALRRRRTLIADQPGLGKGHPLSSRVATPNGYRAVGELAAGDHVIGSDGKSTKILNIFDRGMLPVYKVVTNDGASTLVDGEHLWTVYDDAVGDFITIDTIEVAGRCATEELCLPMLSGPVEFDAVDLPHEPLTAGLALISADSFVEKIDVDLSQYEIASVSQRISFLSGVVRKLGRIRGADSHIRVLIKNPLEQKPVADAVIQIVRSLGGLVKVHRSFIRWRLDIYLPDDIWYPIVGYAKPKARINRRWKNFQPGVPSRYITEVIPAGMDMVRCLSVAAEDSLYCTDEYLLTHNTVSAIGVSNNIPGVTSMLIVCLASHKEHWKRAVEQWDIHGLSVGIAEGDYFPDTECVVINYDILHRHYETIRAGCWGILICDEAHALQNPESRRTLNVFGGKVVQWEYVDDPRKPGKPKRVKADRLRYEPIEAERELYLTGTPIPNRVKNLWPLIKRCDPTGLGRSREAFAIRYCAMYTDAFGKDNDNGASNLDELRHLLRDRFMVRHLKDDVLKDLPPKTRQIIPLDSAGLQKKLAAEKDAASELLRLYEEKMGIHKDMDMESLAELVMRAQPAMFDDYAKNVEDNIGMDTPLHKLAIARSELALAKVPMAIEHIQNLMEQGQKVVVFAYHRAVIEALRDRWSNSCALIYGATPTKKRQEEADRFQNDSDCNPFIGQYTAAGTGYTLTAAYIVVCVELTWLSHELSQAEDRCHRIGQTDAVVAHHLIVQGSLDESLLAKIVTKQEIIDQALDGPQGEENVSNSESRVS